MTPDDAKLIACAARNALPRLLKLIAEQEAALSDADAELARLASLVTHDEDLASIGAVRETIRKALGKGEA